MSAFVFPPEEFDLVNAQASLFFTEDASLDNLMGNIRKSLVKGGVFTGDLLGEKDGWKEEGVAMAYRTRAQVEAYFTGMKLHKFEEIFETRPMVMGSQKVWHSFNIIAERT